MYNNVGKKIKTIAKIFAWIGIILSIIYGLIFIGAGVAIGIYNANFGYDFFDTFEYEYSGYQISINPVVLIVIGLLIAIAGSVLSWLSSCVIYGMGEEIDKINQIEKKVNVFEPVILNTLNENAKINEKLSKTNEMLEKICLSLSEKEEQKTEKTEQSDVIAEYTDSDN